MQLWGWAQAEGGAYWNYSQHEIAEMLEPGADLDPHLELLRTRRCACSLRGVAAPAAHPQSVTIPRCTQLMDCWHPGSRMQQS